MNNRMTIIEYERVYRKGDNSISALQFDKVEEFILQNIDNNGERLLNLGADAKGKYFSALNYVGIIQLKDGFTIEILPKITSGYDEDICRIVFLKMLAATVNINYKISDLADLGTHKDNLLEVFISMFLDEAEKLIQRGLRSGYTEFTGNEYFFKGRLNISQNIRDNLIHKERFNVTYDVFNTDRSENRLIRSTLDKLRRLSGDPANQRRILRAVQMMEEIPLSNNYDADFARCALDRNMSGYATILAWSKVFLKNKTFTSYNGDSIAYALLFPMEKVFESFVAQQVKRYCTDYDVYTQSKRKYLFDNKFMLLPDIVLEKSHKTMCIIDTKWKILNNNPNDNYGISQADMYQMFAYAKKFSCSSIVLCYPEPGNNKQYKPYTDGDITVNIKTIDLSLLKSEDSIDKTKKMIESLVCIKADQEENNIE